MNTGISIHKFNNINECDSFLVSKATEDINISIEERNIAAIAVSGGRTPASFLRLLAHSKIDWSKVVVTLVDERWVETSHEDSNELLVRKNLFQNVRSNPQPTFIPLFSESSIRDEAERVLEERLRQIKDVPFAAVVLGVGLDGHTASFFEGTNSYERCLQLPSNEDCCFVENIPGKFDHNRMTLSLNRLSRADNIYLQATGDQKLNVLESSDPDLAVHRVSRNLPIAGIWCP